MSEEYNENEEFEQDESFEDNDQYEEENEELERKPKKGSRIVLVIAVFALIGLNAFLGYNIFNQKKELEAQAAKIERLNNTKDSLNTVVTELESQVLNYKEKSAADSANIAELLSQIDNLKTTLSDKDATIAKYKSYRNEVFRLRKLQAQWESEKSKIDSLEKENKRLAAERAAFKEAADTLSQAVNELETENQGLADKVARAQRLKGAITKIEGQKIKKGRVRETDRASQVNAMDICYNINSNDVAVKGKRSVFIVVKKSGKTIGDAVNVFDLANGKSMSYTLKDEIAFKGQSEEFCANFGSEANPLELESGTYTVEIYIDGIKLNDKDNSIELR